MNIKDMGDRIRDYKLDALNHLGGSCRSKNGPKNNEEWKFFVAWGNFQTNSASIGN